MRNSSLRLDRDPPQAAAPRRTCEVRPGGLFGSLDDEAFESLRVDITSVDCPSDRRVYARGERGGAVYAIQSGIVRFERVTERGDRRIVRVAGRGDLIGQDALLERPHADDAVACTDLRLCAIPATLIHRLCGSRSALRQEIMSRWLRAMDDAQYWTTELVAGPARRRVLMMLSLLLRHADDDGTIWLPRREEMAAMLDMAFETSSRILSQLRREGVLAPARGRSTQVDAGRLKAAIDAANR